LIIHSFDSVLREPRKMHSFQWAPGSPRVALWRPIEMMAVVYFIAAEVVVLVADNMVSFVDVLDMVFARGAAMVLYYVIAPVGLVWIAMSLEIDGRSPHRWLISAMRYFRRPSRTLAGRAVRAESSRTAYRGRIRFRWDLAAPRLHHGWVRGGRISCRDTVRFSHAFRHSHPVIKASDDGTLVRNRDVAKLEVRP
jgi:hypothetical protein